MSVLKQWSPMEAEFGQLVPIQKTNLCVLDFMYHSNTSKAKTFELQISGTYVCFMSVYPSQTAITTVQF